MKKTVYGRWMKAFRDPHALKVFKTLHQQPYRSIRKLSIDTGLHSEIVRRVIKGSKHTYSKLPLLVYWKPLYPKPKNNYNRLQLQLAPLGCLIYHILERYDFDHNHPAARQLIRELYVTMVDAYRNQQKVSTIFRQLKEKSAVWQTLSEEVFSCPSCRKQIFLSKKITTPRRNKTQNYTHLHHTPPQNATGNNPSTTQENFLEDSINFDVASKEIFPLVAEGEPTWSADPTEKTDPNQNNQIQPDPFNRDEQQPTKTIQISENSYLYAERDENEKTNNQTARRDSAQEKVSEEGSGVESDTPPQLPTALNNELKRRLAARLRPEYFKLYDEIENDIKMLLVTVDRIAMRCSSSFTPEDPKLPTKKLIQTQVVLANVFYKIYQKAALECGASIDQLLPPVSSKEELVQWLPAAYCLLSEKNELLRRNFLVKLANLIYFYFRVALSPYYEELGVNFQKFGLLSVHTFHRVFHKVESIYKRVSKWRGF